MSSVFEHDLMEPAGTARPQLAGTPDFGLTGCPAGTQMIAITFKHPPTGNEDADFYIQIN